MLERNIFSSIMNLELITRRFAIANGLKLIVAARLYGKCIVILGRSGLFRICFSIMQYSFYYRKETSIQVPERKEPEFSLQ